MSGPSSNQISLFAAAIAENTAKYDVWLSSQGIPTPSFDGGAPVGLNLPHEISEAREAVIESTAELQALMLGPLGYVQQHMREVSILVPTKIRCSNQLARGSIIISLLSKASIVLILPPVSRSTRRHRISRYHKLAIW